jgi:hypothetical protein
MNTAGFLLAIFVGMTTIYEDNFVQRFCLPTKMTRVDELIVKRNEKKIRDLSQLAIDF